MLPQLFANFTAIISGIAAFIALATTVVTGLRYFFPSLEASKPNAKNKWRNLLIFSAVGLLIFGSILAASIYFSRPPGPGTILRAFHGHHTWVNAVAWSPDGKSIASASRDGTVQVWDAETGKLIFDPPHRDPSANGEVVAMAWSPDGKHIASSTYDGTVQVWDAATGHDLFSYPGNSLGGIQSIAWSSDSKSIASIGSDGIIQVTDASTRKTTATDGSFFAISLAWSHDDRYLAAGDLKGEVLVRDVRSGLIQQEQGNSGAVWSISWSPTKEFYATGNNDGTVQVWFVANLSSKIRTGELRHYTLDTNAVRAVAWSPDGERIASGGEGRIVRIWDISSGKPLFTFSDQHSPVLSLAWSPDGTKIVSGGEDGTVLVWQAP